MTRTLFLTRTKSEEWSVMSTDSSGVDFLAILSGNIGPDKLAGYNFCHISLQIKRWKNSPDLRGNIIIDFDIGR